MKIILSRKGWDSGSGGLNPSPVFPDGMIQSLPIGCDPGSPTYASIAPSAITAKGYPNLDAFFAVYPPRWIPTNPYAHLDPDLEHAAYPRLAGWSPCFGQQGAAAAHLTRLGVGIGDLFLFYGWFDDVRLSGGRWLRRHNDCFLIWGWLQVGSILTPPFPPWLHYHPHAVHAGSYGMHNRIYVAAPSLTGESDHGRWAGGGVFTHEHPNRNLTLSPGHRGLYPTGLPVWFSSAMSRFRQEHVLDTTGIPLAGPWLSSIFV